MLFLCTEDKGYFAPLRPHFKTSALSILSPHQLCRFTVNPVIPAVEETSKKKGYYSEPGSSASLSLGSET